MSATDFNDRLGDYVDVAARIAEFRTKYPEGSLQPADPVQPYRVQTIGDRVFIVVVAAAYRTPDDARPGVGMAYEPWPGRTPYTRDSELMNAETSAWGRAIVAVLAADTKRGIASAQELRPRHAELDGTAWNDADQEQLGDAYIRDIDRAQSLETIQTIRAAVMRQVAAGEVSPETNQRIAAAAGRRLQELQPALPADGEHAPTQRATKRMHASFPAGISRDERLEIMRRVTGRPTITTSNELTARDVDAIIVYLDKAKREAK